jgi:8-oxo-dGTP pyrophosphatase MutT (NUDIX family)
MRRKIKSCGVLIVRGKPIREFLLMIHPDRFDLPKGHVDPGESDLDCALRELEEETGIPMSAIELDPEFRFETHYQVRPERFGHELCDKTTVIYLAHLHGNHQIRTSEHQGFEWRPWSPPHKIQPETIDPLLAAVETHIAHQGPSRK